MVIEEIDIEGVAVLEPENDSPIPANSHGPEARQSAFEPMQTITGNAERLGRLGGVQAGENPLDFAAQSRSDPAWIAILIEPLEAAMAEAPDHTRLYSDKCRLSTAAGSLPAIP